MKPEDILQELPEPVLPEEPYKRNLTKQEIDKILIHFPKFAFFTKIDDYNRIIMGGGDFDKGGLFIEPEDLLKLN